MSFAISKKNKYRNDSPVLYDKWLLFASLSLIAFGLLMVASSSIVISQQQYGQSFHYLMRQSIYLGFGAVCALFVLRVNTRFWQYLGIPLLFISLLLLVVVLIPGIGRVVNGSSRWIGMGPLSIQISELAKLGVVIYLAGYLVRHEQVIATQLLAFIRPLFLLGIVAVLLLLEPDFGAVIVIMGTAMAMLFLGGVRVRHFFMVFLIMSILVVILAVSSPYRLERLTTFLNPWAHPFTGGYQLTQALIAFGRGGWLGVGLGESIQKLFYLPEAHTDFLFAVLAEELGLIGALAVMSLFCLLIFRALVIAKRAMQIGNLFGGYMAYGFAISVGLQVMINVGVNAGVLPTKGLTLPLMSYGGSSMLINCIIIALLLRIDHEGRWANLGV